MTDILVLHPGAMGSSLAACLRSNGHKVSWVAQNRSSVTRERAEAEGLHAYATLEKGLAAAEVVISICPPEFAVATAQTVVEHAFQGVYVDANATSPMTATRIADLVGDRYVDGSVIGPPARQSGSTRTYLSGPQATAICELFAGTFATPKNLGTAHDAASALKMCYAAYTKGTTALLLNIRALAEANQIEDALLAEWVISQPELQTRSDRAGPGVSGKAWRFAAEMREIADTFGASGLPGDFHEGAALVYERLAAFKDKPPATTSELVATLLAER